MSKKPKQMSLRDVRNIDALDSLRRDHYDHGDWYIMTDSNRVWISKQKIGHERTDHINVPKAIFDKMIDDYLKPQSIGEWRGKRFHRGA